MLPNFWIAYLDIYGFAAQVSGGEMEQLSLALSEIFDGAARDLDAKGIQYYFLSDSVILACRDDGYASFNKLITATKLIQRQAIERNLVFRGAVAHGAMRVMKNVCVGESLIRAYQVEQGIGCPVVVLPEREFLRSGYSPLPKFSLVPTKDGGEISAVPLFPAPLGELIDHCQRMIERAQRDGPAVVVRPWKLLLELAVNYQNNGKDDE